MQNQIKFLKSYYPFIKKMNSFVLEISLDSYAEIFNDFDPSPYRKKDLNPELVDYLDDCSADIPLKYPLILQFNVPKNHVDSDEEKRVKDGLKAYYAFGTFGAHNEYKKLIYQSILNVIIATILLSISILFEFFHPGEFFLSVIQAGITVGGWVFLWQAITMVVFERKSIKKKYLTYKRFNEAIIKFNH